MGKPKLKPYQKPHFLPPKFNPDSWSKIKPFFDNLQKREINNSEDLINFLKDWTELDDAIGEDIALKYVRMTGKTDNPKFSKDYEFVIKNIVPQFKTAEHNLEEKYTKVREKIKLDKRYLIYERNVKSDLKIFKPRNIPLETQEELLGQEYQKITGSLTADFDGQEQTLIQISKVLEETDRTRRQKAWETIAHTRAKVRNRLDSILDQMIILRTRIAQNAGFSNYVDFRFAQMHRFDYRPSDCEDFAVAVKRYFVPLLEKIHVRRMKELKLISLRPWDTVVDIKLRPPLKPFATSLELLNKTQNIFNRLDPNFSSYFRSMGKLELLDLDNRKGKAPGAYQETFPKSRLPYIFLNSTGVDNDVKTLLHESGHALNSLSTRDEWFGPYRHPPLEFAEVASMGMELLAHSYLNEFYSPEDSERSKVELFESIISLLCWIAIIDSFQRWLYTHPKHSNFERREAWRMIYGQFTPIIDWSEYEIERDYLWQRQLHIFLHPLYYIEYGIAQLGALQLWQNALRDQKKALMDYKRALTLGGSVPLEDLFRTAGLNFGLNERQIEPLAKLLAIKLNLV